MALKIGEQKQEAAAIDKLPTSRIKQFIIGFKIAGILAIERFENEL
jgi:hypothetical protein